ncbi:O-antigen ligase family protein [Clostridium tertium]|jgi:exopolysaccharide production protein ExoQ|uniref:O-antigen ligase family protein n=1 Tax=Clostridium tertium TaxID=1559 RepID=UPI000DCFB39A|nr:O-antigen ligase family protein [Clostridium tertium]
MYKKLMYILNIYLIINLMPIQRGMLKGILIFNKSIYYSILVVAMFIAISSYYKKNNFKSFIINKNIYSYWLIIFIISICFSINKLKSIQFIFLSICLTIYIMYTIELHINKKIDIIKNFILSSSILLFINNILILLNVSGTRYIDFRYGTTLNGIFTHRIHHGLVIILVGIISVYGLLNYKNKLFKMLCTINIINCSILLFNVKSQTANISIIFLLSLYILNKKMKVVSITFIIPWMYIILGTLQYYINVFNEYFLKYGIDLTLTGRLDIWKGVLSIVKLKPVFGYGYGAFWTSNNMYRNYFDAYYYDGGHAHNGLLDMVLQVGLVGTILLLIIIYTVARRLSKLEKYKLPEFRLCYFFMMYIGIWSISEPINFGYEYINIFNYILIFTFILLNFRLNKIKEEKNELSTSGNVCV